MDGIEVPDLFLCPISYEIMKDPVTVSSGITYDRSTIEKWLFSGHNTTCPVTKHDISGSDLTPNHTLRRFIQSWCTLNAHCGIERIPTPKPPATHSQIASLLADAKSPPQQLKCLRRLRSIAAENATNKRCIESAGAIEFLAGIVCDFAAGENNSDAGVSEEALSILHNLQLSESGLKYLVGRRNGEFVESLTRIMKCGSYYESRAYSLFLLKSMLEIAEPMQLTSLKPQLFTEIVQVLKDEISPQATKAALKLMVNVLPWGRNRVKAVEAGAVTVVIEQLLVVESSEKRRCEMMLTAMDMMCGCAEGRAELFGHAAGLAVVSKKILRVSRVATERGVRILMSMAKFSGSTAVVQEMAAAGAVGKLCLVIQMAEDGSGRKMKERAREVLKLHARVWKNSPCLPRDLIASL